jgi:hypothetical protein
LTYDSNYNVKVYVNGLLVSGGTSVNPEDFRDNLAFGNWNDVGSTAVSAESSMKCKIYDRPLSDCEVRNLYSAANGGACEICDNVAPTTNATTPINANSAGWHISNVSVSLSSSDNAGGTGVNLITYSAIGAQVIAPTTVNGASVNLSITAEGEHDHHLLCGRCRRQYGSAANSGH